MKIAVLVKQVPGSETALPILGNHNWIDEEQVDCKNWDPVESDIKVEVTDDEFIKLHKEYDL